MVLAEAGMVGADQIEQSLQPILPSSEIAHVVAASIEQNLIRNSVMTQINLIKDQPAPNPEESAGKIQQFNQNPQTTKPPVRLLDVSRNSSYYGSDSTSLAASDIKKELGVAA